MVDEVLARTIRFRITTVAVLAVLAVLVVAGVALVLLQRNTLTANIDQTLTQRADDIVALLGQADPPQVFASGPSEGFAQLLDVDGRVMASTSNLDGEQALEIPVGASDTYSVVGDLPVDDDVFRVLSRPLDNGALFVGTTYDVVSESTAALATSLALIIPAITVVLGALVWVLVGRTLRPVEDIRSEVGGIGSTDLHRRVPRPGTDDEIDRLAVTMNLMLERLESSNERQQRFVADASHELRSPLTRLRTEIELDVAAAPSPPERDRLQSKLGEVIEMQQIVENLLYLARSDAGEIPQLFRPLDLDDVVFSEEARIKAQARVQVDVSGVSGAHIAGDRAQISRAVKNLLDNAERYATRRIVLTLAENNGNAVFTVADDGPGVPALDADKIFERFGRVDESRTSETGGTGLGLAIAREIAQRHGGTLLLVNPGEAGAAFEMTLPVHH